MSKKALQILKELFAENSNLQVPVGVAEQVIEIRKWATERLEELEKVEFKTEQK